MKLFLVLIFGLVLTKINGASLESNKVFPIPHDVYETIENYLNQLYHAPDNVNLNELIIVAAQYGFDYLENGNHGVLPNNYGELKEKWIDVIHQLRDEGSDAVTLDELKPFFKLIQNGNFVPSDIIDIIGINNFNTYINGILSAPNEITLNEIIIIVTQNLFIYLQEPSNGIELPSNYYDLVAEWIEVIFALRDHGSEAVTVKMMRNFISLLL